MRVACGWLSVGVGKAVGQTDSLRGTGAGGTEDDRFCITTGIKSRAGAIDHPFLSYPPLLCLRRVSVYLVYGWVAGQAPPRPDVEQVKQKEGRLAATQTELALRDPASPDYATPVMETVRCCWPASCLMHLLHAVSRRPLLLYTVPRLNCCPCPICS